MEKHITERWQNKSKPHCRGIVGKGLLHSTAPRESGNHLHSHHLGFLGSPWHLNPILFLLCSVHFAVLFKYPPCTGGISHSSSSVTSLSHPTRWQCWQCELHPSLAPAFLGGTENPPYLHYFPTSAWKTQRRTTSPKQHQSSGKQKEVKGKLFIAKPSSFVVKYCLISSLRHLLSHSPYYFSSYYCLIFPIQKVHTDTSQFPFWHNCLGETSSCFTGVLKN